MIALAYRPFLDPINPLQHYWFLLVIPLSLGIALSYKAVRVWDMSTYWREVVVMTLQLVLGMIAMGLAMMSGQLSTIAFWLLETFPAFALVG